MVAGPVHCQRLRLADRAGLVDSKRDQRCDGDVGLGVGLIRESLQEGRVLRNGEPVVEGDWLDIEDLLDGAQQRRHRAVLLARAGARPGAYNV